MKNAKKTSSREVDAARLMIKISHMHRRTVEKFVSDFGVPRSQHRLLMHIERMSGAPSQSELARQLDVSGATVAVMLKKLEAAGYIERCAAAVDSRSNEITLTPAGLDVVSRTRRKFSEIDEAFFGALSDDELECFISHMEKIVAHASDTEGRKKSSSEKE